MRRLLWVLLLSALCSFAGDLTGKWRGGFNMKDDSGEDHHEDALLILKQDGQKVTGTAGPNEDKQWQLENVELSGDTLIFTVTPEEHAPVKVSLKLDGSKLTGDVEGEHDGQPFKARMELTREP